MIDRFVETFNSRDKDAWADSLHYPHVRPSPRGPSRVSPSASAYASAFSYDRILATGSDHTEFDERRVLHVSLEKVHVAGQWSRYDSSRRKILTNKVVYVCTHLGDRWGIQARFGADSVEGDGQERETGARAAIERFVTGLGAGNAEAVDAATHLPLVEIEPGEVREWPDAAHLVRGITLRDCKLDDVEWVHIGSLGVNAALKLSVRGKPLGAVVLVTRAEPGWGVRAISTLRPQDAA